MNEKRNKIIIESGIIRIIDPIYDKDWWGSKTFNNCLRGNWNFKIIKNKNKRIKELIVYHEKNDDYKNKDWKYCKDISLIVTSKKVCLFDEKYYMVKDNIIFDREYIKYKNGISVFIFKNICNIFIQKNEDNKIVLIKMNFEKMETINE